MFRLDGWKLGGEGSNIEQGSWRLGEYLEQGPDSWRHIDSGQSSMEPAEYKEIKYC